MIRPRSILAALIAAACLEGAVACGAPQTKSQVELSRLPPYTGRDKELFDDSIEASAVGMTMDKPTFRGDARFRERAQRATMVARVKITTVTIDKVDDRSTYHLTMAVIGVPLAGSGESALELTLREGENAFPLVNQLREGLRDRTLLAMWKRFREGDDASAHFYAAPDDDGTVAAAKEAIVLHEVTKK
jgi:hypothetical protein